MTAAAPAGALPAVRARPRNVFLVANNVEELGGVQRFVRTLAAGLVERGHRVHVIGISHAEQAHSWPGEAGYPTTTLYDVPELSAWRARRLKDRFDVAGRLRERRRRRQRAAAVERLDRVFRSVADGVVICAQVWAMEWVAAADCSHLHVVGMSHEMYEASRGLTAASRGSTRYRRMTRLYRDVDALLLLTRQDADKFERDDFGGVGVMPNPVSVFPPEPAALDAPRIVSIGRFAAEKRLDRLVDAFALVADEHPDWRLDLYGGGPRARQLARQVKRLKLQERVALHDAVEDVVPVLLSASVFALSSDNEGLPLTLAEAMACGVPCVAVDCSAGVRELVQHEIDGLVVVVETEALAAGLQRLMADPGLRRQLGEQARVSIHRFSPDRVLDRWEALFDELDR